MRKQAAEFAATQSRRQKDARRAKKAKVREEAAEGSSYVPRDEGHRSVLARGRGPLPLRCGTRRRT